jgi:hypothetical protein
VIRSSGSWESGDKIHSAPVLLFKHNYHSFTKVEINMPQKIMKWFYSPQFPDDEDKTRIAGMLHIILLVFLSVIIVAIMLGVTGSVSITNRAFFNLSVVIAPSSIITMLVLLHKGYVSVAAWIFVFFQWLSTVIQILGSGGIESPAISAFIATLLLAGFLISGRAVTIFTALSVLAILRIWQLQNASQLPHRSCSQHLRRKSFSS